MAKNVKWQDDYWLPLMQVYLMKPVGMKPLYHRSMVELGMELHIAPQVLFSRMCQLANMETPRIEHIWQTYGHSPRKLKRAVHLWREMRGYGNASEFYEGVELNETFETDFKAVSPSVSLTPVQLVMVLDLYFRLTPVTMVAETPEVQELARLIKVKPQEVSDVMAAYRQIDPYLRRKEEGGAATAPYVEPCRAIWRRYGNSDLESLASYARQLREYFVS
ncbi:MAG: hypothetical protein K5764_09375 [Prevotella sp.]|nr:hypothetical protein [Prevotella sp.]